VRAGTCRRSGGGSMGGTISHRGLRRRSGSGSSRERNISAVTIEEIGRRIGRARARSGTGRCVRDGGDGTEGLGGLRVGLGGAGGVDVNTRNGDIVGLADLEFASVVATCEGVLGRAVVAETDTVEGVLAVAGIVIAAGVTYLQAELVGADELSPPVDLVRGRTEGGPIHEATNGITALILTSRVELASKVISLDVDLGLVNETRDHPVVVIDEELGALKSAGGYNASAMTRLSAPCNFFTLAIGDAGVWVLGGP